MNRLLTFLIALATCISLAGCGHHHKRPYLFVVETERLILPIGSTTTGHIDNAGDVDLYSIVLSSGITYRIFTTNLSAGMDTVIRLFNSSGELLAENDNFSEEDLSSLIELLITEDGVYTVAVSHKDFLADSGMYDLIVEVVNPDTECPKLHHGEHCHHDHGHND